MKPVSSQPEPVPRPEDFPLGSPQSRAAARALLQTRSESVHRIEITSHLHRPGCDNSRPHASPWQAMTGGGRMRIVYVPPGMSIEEARRVVDG